MIQLGRAATPSTFQFKRTYATPDRQYPQLEEPKVNQSFSREYHSSFPYPHLAPIIFLAQSKIQTKPDLTTNTRCARTNCSANEIKPTSCVSEIPRTYRESRVFPACLPHARFYLLKSIRTGINFQEGSPFKYFSPRPPKKPLSWRQPR